MDKDITCQVVILPAEQQSITELLKTLNNKLWFNENESLTLLPGNVSQHLYLVSDREIPINQYCYDKEVGEVFKAVFDMKSTSVRFRVEATTDRSLGLPLIPESWIKDVYVPSQGKIDKMRIEWDKYNNCPVLEGPMTIGAHVVIPPIKDSWNRKELQLQNLQLLKDYITFATSDDDTKASEWYLTWFDQNY